MRRRFTVRAATLLLALLVSLAGLRALPSWCTDGDDCVSPCCKDKSGGEATVRPLLPCCRVIALGGAPHKFQESEDPPPPAILASTTDADALPVVLLAVPQHPQLSFSPPLQRPRLLL